MSGSLDLQSVKTRQLILQNPDGSFPAKGDILAVIDNLGTIGPVKDISVSSVMVDNVNITGAILQTNIAALDITSTSVQTNTLIVTGLFTGNDIQTKNTNTVYLTAGDINSGPILTSSLTSNSLFAPTVDILQGLSAETIHTDSLSAQYISAGAANINDVSADILTVGLTTKTPFLLANDISANTARFTDISSQHMTIRTVIRASDVSANTVETNTINVSNTLNTRNLDVQGTFTFNELALTTLIANNMIVTADISTNLFTSVGSTVIRDISARNYNIQNLNVTDLYNVNSLTSDVATVTDLSAGKIKTEGVTATERIFIGTAATPVLFATTAYSNRLDTAIIETPRANVSSNIRLNGGILTYSPPSKLLVNGIATNDTSALYQQPYNTVPIYNGLTTIDDISNTLNNLTTSFNNFMDIFNTRGLVVSLNRNIKLNSVFNIRFVSSGGVASVAAIGTGTYTLTQLIALLNASSVNRGITFTLQNVSGIGPQVTITGTGAAISDISSTPTSSLQLLRYIGFNINDSNNPFQTYVFNTTDRVYRSTLYTLTGPQISTNPISPTINIPNTLPKPLYTISAIDPYTASLTLTNSFGTNATYFYIDISDRLFPASSNPQIIYNLVPNTTYSTRGMYIDAYNRGGLSTTPVTFSTPNIQPPTGLSASSIKFNSITLTWNSPYSGQPYTYDISATGPFIPTVTTTAATTYTFTNLVQNSAYSFTIYTVEPRYNKRSSTAATISTTTAALIVPAPTILTNSPTSGVRPPNNTTAVISWGATSGNGTLYYTKQGVNQTYPIPTGITSYNLTGLPGTGDISGLLVFTDNSRNTVAGTVTTANYDASFGFYDSAATPGTSYVLDGTTNLGLGFLFATSTLTVPWNSFQFNRITFQQNLIFSSPGTTTLTAEIYNITPSVYYDLLTTPTGQITPFDITALGTVLTSSETTTTSIVLFSSPVTITQSTVVLFRVQGGGTITFATNSGTSAFATALRYTSTGLFNDFVNSSNGVINCQFTIV